MPHEPGGGHGTIDEGVGRALRAEDSVSALRRLRLILDAVEEGVCEIDAAGVTTFANRAAERMLGWRAEELQGRSQHDVIHHTYPDGTPFRPADCPIMQALEDGRRRVVSDGVFWTRTGERLPVTYTATPLDEGGRTVGAVVAFRDLSTLIEATAEARDALVQRDSAQEARSSAERNLEWLYNVLELAPALVLITRGPAHAIQFANAAARRLAGDRPLEGLRLEHALPEVARQGLLALFDRVYREFEPYIGVEDRVRVEPPGMPPLEVYLNRVLQPLTLPNGDRGVFLHNVNVTREVEARREVERKAAELGRLAAELERSNAELDQFAYATSHDLKAPLRGISHLTTWLQQDHADDLEGQALAYVKLIDSRVHRLESMIDGLLEYSRAGRSEEASEPVDLARLVDEVVDLIPGRQGLSVEVEGVFPTIVTAGVRVRQVLQNLVANAVNYADTRVVIRCRADAGGEWLQFAVIDDGPGIDPRDHERIWGVFQRLERGDDKGGTGIGLALVRRIVQEAGGDAWLESVPGEGATFLFTWPLSGAGEEAA